MTKQKVTTREKLLVCAIIIAFMSLNIVLGSFFSPRSWAPAVVTAAASYLIIFIVVAAAAGIRFLYRDWKTPSRDTAREPRWAHPDARPRPGGQPRAPSPARTTEQFRDHRRRHQPRAAVRLFHHQPVH